MTIELRGAVQTVDTACDRSFLGQGDFVYRVTDPPVFVEAEGYWLIDKSGRRYLDAEAANGTVAFGYDRSILRDAVERLGAMPSLPSFCEVRPAAFRGAAARRVFGRRPASTAASALTSAARKGSNWR